MLFLRCHFARYGEGSRGFSLVELAISMMVLGVLLSLAIMGGNVLRNSKVAATATKLDEIEKSLVAFRDLYKSLPGDFSRATSLMANCSTATQCGNGDGNGAIQAISTGSPDWNDAFTHNESSYAWRHLALSGADLGVSVSSVKAWGKSHPFTPLGGGAEIFFDGNHSINGAYGHFLRLSGVLISSGDLASGQGLDVTASKMLDLKIDNGLPSTGRITAETLSSGDDACVSSGAYLSNETYFSTLECVLFIEFYNF